MIGRRSFLFTGAAAICAPLLAKTRHKVGVQLYTVRDLLVKEPQTILQAIAQMGYTEVEVLRNQVTLIAPYLRQAALRAVSLHFETPLITGNWKAWKDAEMPPAEPGVTFESTLALAKQHNFEYVVFNYLTPEERLGLDFYRALADKLNAAAEKCHAAGMRFCYHNHDFEFQPKPGGRPIDVLLDRLDKKLIGLEVDTFWVSMAGEDAAAFLRQNTGRVELVHLKDRAPGTPRHYDIATVPNDTFRELGHGDLPIPKILAAAVDAGAKHFFVEQDFSPDPIRSLRQSYAYLESIHF